MRYLIMFIGLILPLSVFAGEGSPEIFDTILNFLTSGLGASATIAVILEFGLRLIKSKKPLSVLYGISVIVHKLGEILIKLGELLDKVLPQRLK